MSLEADFIARVRVIFFVVCLFVTHPKFAVFLSLFVCPKDTAWFGDASSPNDVIEFVIVGGKQKAPADG
jgi:hypothetical protein